VFEKIMAAASLVPESIMGTIEAAVDDPQVEQEMRDKLGLEKG